MNAAVTQQFSSDLEPFFDDNACSYELCTGILYQGCQSFQRFSVCQEIIDKKLMAVDLTASIMCLENKMPMLVFGLNEENSIVETMSGNFNGTKVTV